MTAASGDMTSTTLSRDDLERLLRLEWEAEARRADDPWWRWEPSADQEAFIVAVLSGRYDENWFLAANRSGKTDVAAWLVAGFVRFGRRNPRYPDVGGRKVDDLVKRHAHSMSGTIVSLDFGNSRDVVQPKLFANGFGRDPSHGPFIPDREIDGWSVTNQILRLQNGNILGFKSADQGGMKQAGAARDFVMFDEEPPYPVYEENTIRVGGDSELVLIGACTLLPPEGSVGGVSWVYEEKVKPWKAGRAKWINIQTSSIYNNKHIKASEIERLERLYPEGSFARKIRLEGELLPGLSGSRAYTSFDAQIHVKDLGADPWLERRPIVWAMDFNVEPLCSLVGQRVGDTFRVYREIVLQEGSIPEMAEEFKNVVRGRVAEVWIYGDASGRARHASTGKTEYQLLLQALKGLGMPVRLKVPEANPAVTDRVNAVNNALKSVADGVVHVEIDQSCVELAADLEGVLRTQDGKIKKTSNRKDPYYYRTHISDAFGYWINYEEPIRVKNFQGEGRRPAPVRPSYHRRAK